MSLFRPASKSQSRLRMALIGPSGSGKTFSSLAIASELAAHHMGSGRIAVIDTEHGSASKYADRFSFDVLELAQFDPRAYIEAIQAAEAEGFNVIIIDSLSHAWSGKGGALELVDKAAKRSKSNNTFTAWRDVTPLHNALVDSIIGSNCHVIATMRSKVDYVLETDPNTGKQMPRKVGLAPIQREGMDYEFDVVGDIDLDHNLVITKTRCEQLDGEIVNKPGRQLGAKLAYWLSDGAPIPETISRASAPIHPVEDVLENDRPAIIHPIIASLFLPTEMIADIHRLVALTGTTDVQLRSALARRGVSAVENLSVDDARTIIRTLEGVASKMPNVQSANAMGDELVAKMQSERSDQALETSDQLTGDQSGSDADDHVVAEVARKEEQVKSSKSRKKGADKESVVDPPFEPIPAPAPMEIPEAKNNSRAVEPATA